MDEIRFKFLSDSVLKAFEKDGRKYCRLTASSNAEDLVGDVMSQKALEQMKSAAVGTASPFGIFDFGFAIASPFAIADLRFWTKVGARLWFGHVETS